jgi:hypothetical protein
MAQHIRSLLNDIASEVAEEAKQKQSPEERTLHTIAQKLLLLERDLKAPGAARSSDERVDRILEAIAKEKF